MKKILIIGSSKNLGSHLYKKFRNNSKVIRLSSSLKTNKIKNIYNCNLLSFNELKITILEIKKKYGELDGIIFTTGKSNFDKKLNCQSRFTQSFNINFITFANFIDAYLKFYKLKTNIIVISSIAGVKSIGAPDEYSIAKNALNFYCKILAKSLIKKKIIINIISPGNILQKGNLWDKKLKISKYKTLKYIKDNVPSNNFVNPNDIYNFCNQIILFNKSNLVGQNLVIDGGQVL
jgi:NAD(P)-dependent dehydrogenase (short-subunit alcohol dehydrogenase family)